MLSLYSPSPSVASHKKDQIKLSHSNRFGPFDRVFFLSTGTNDWLLILKPIDRKFHICKSVNHFRGNNKITTTLTILIHCRFKNERNSTDKRIIGKRNRKVFKKDCFNFHIACIKMKQKKINTTRFEKKTISSSRVAEKKTQNKTRPQLCEQSFLTHIWKVIGDWRVNSQLKMNTFKIHTISARVCAHECTYKHERWWWWQRRQW